jgi:hypothetical protein
MIKDGLDSVISDVVGHGVMFLFGSSMIIKKYFDLPENLDDMLRGVAVGGLIGGIYHYHKIHGLNMKFKNLLKKTKDNPAKVKKIDYFFNNLDKGNLSDKYTVYLYKRQREKIIRTINKA